MCPPGSEGNHKGLPYKSGGCRPKGKPMKKKLFFVAVASLILASVHLAEAQKSGQKFRVGYLSAGVAVARKPYLDAFRLGMRDFGFVEGENLILETRFAEGKYDRLPALAEDLAQVKPDVILASTSLAVLAAKKAMASIPIVMVAVSNPVGAGLVASLARPGGNVTGITNINADLVGKRLELLKEILPSLSRVGVLSDPSYRASSSAMRNAEEAARALKLTLEPVAAIRSRDDLPGAFDAVVKGRATAAIRMVDPLVSALRKETTDLAVKRKLPIIYAYREDVEAGGLVSYGTDLPTQYRQTARFVNKILKGAKPADLPVEQPTKFELVINLKTAKQIGLTIPPNVLARADKVIKESAGINRHGVADERAAQERSSAPFWLRVMRLGPKGRGRSVDRGTHRPGMELRNHHFGVPTVS